MKLITINNDQLLRQEGESCAGLVGIGIAFIHDVQQNKFIISNSVKGSAAEGWLED